MDMKVDKVADEVTNMVMDIKVDKVPNEVTNMVDKVAVKLRLEVCQLKVGARMALDF